LDSDTPHFSARTATRKILPVTPTAKETVQGILARLPARHSTSLKNIVLDYRPDAQRGLGGQTMVILRANLPQNEITAVLIHEIGHNVDLGLLEAPTQNGVASTFHDGDIPVLEGDSSLAFYRINWDSNSALKRTASNLDFVSGYAMSDPFEDFAETYVFYVLHNADFRALTAGSDALAKKYAFMRDAVFSGKEFATGNANAIQNLNRRSWDVTVLPYDLEQFLDT
ncbi:MAG: hypothetical protein V2A34_06745, partial [Lentisphaerota bacterium]